MSFQPEILYNQTVSDFTEIRPETKKAKDDILNYTNIFKSVGQKVPSPQFKDKGQSEDKRSTTDVTCVGLRSIIPKGLR